jgi:hypothetical protein
LAMHRAYRRWLLVHTTKCRGPAPAWGGHSYSALPEAVIQGVLHGPSGDALGPLTASRNSKTTSAPPTLLKLVQALDRGQSRHRMDRWEWLPPLVPSSRDTRFDSHWRRPYGPPPAIPGDGNTNHTVLGRGLSKADEGSWCGASAPVRFLPHSHPGCGSYRIGHRSIPECPAECHPPDLVRGFIQSGMPPFGFHPLGGLQPGISGPQIIGQGFQLVEGPGADAALAVQDPRVLPRG